MKLELQNKLCEKYVSGKSLRKLSIEYNIPKTTIYYNLNKKDVIRRQIRVKNLISDNKLLLGIFVGLWAGDGSKFLDKRGKYTIKIHVNKNGTNLINFIKSLYIKLFGKKPKLYLDGGKEKNNASLKIDSKFVYYFIDEYLYSKNRKSHTVSLKENIKKYSKKFLKGFLLGLTLNDGYLKKCFCFSTVSKNLASNMMYILKLFDLEPYCYCVSRNNKWKPIYRIKIRKRKINNLKNILNTVLKELEIEGDISKIKYAS